MNPKSKAWGLFYTADKQPSGVMQNLGRRSGDKPKVNPQKKKLLKPQKDTYSHGLVWEVIMYRHVHVFLAMSKETSCFLNMKLVVTVPASLFYTRSIIYWSVLTKEVSDSVGIGHARCNRPN